MLHSFYAQIALAALVAFCGLAVWKGGPAERYGALLIFATWLVSILGSLSPRELPAATYLISDAILAAGLLVLALRYSNWWMGAAMLLQALGLSFHAAYFAVDKSDLDAHHKHHYVQAMDFVSVAMLFVILGATIASMLKRRRARAAPLPTMGPSPVAG